MMDSDQADGVVRDRPGATPYAFDSAVYSRFDERNTVFMRRHWDDAASFYEKEYRAGARHRITSGEAGYSRIEFARLLASWTVHDCFGGAFSWKRLGQADTAMMQLGRHRVDDPAVMTSEVKRAARMFGADLVGIARIDERWIYSHDRSGDPIDIPSYYTHAIVMGIAMDRETVLTSPSYASAAATGIGYSRMAFTIACVAQFLRNLRYGAIPMGNDTALSIPLAIDAGLGQLGRNGLLVTQEFGPCLRLCKVFTDLPLVPDRPVDFGLADVCANCTRCAEACEGEAISAAREPSYEVACPSNNPGVLRWAVNVDRCYDFWVRNTAACSNCISACPFTQPDGSQRPAAV
jgi:epoxyqueuosine reductase